MQQDRVGRLLHLCKQPSSQRQQDDVWFIRDRLHECSSFFRLWPSQLQQLLCRLLQAQQWVQNEVLVSAGSKPKELCFIIDGEAAVAVRSSPGSSLLKDVALLHAGDTFGELCLLGSSQQPAFVVVRSPVLRGLTVNAQLLAAAMMEGATQAPRNSCSTAPTATTIKAGPGQQGPWPVVDCSQHTLHAANVDMLYSLIGEPRGPLPPKASLKPEQAVRVKQLHSQQLEEAAAAEAATVGIWQQLPHQRAAAQACAAFTTAATSSPTPVEQQGSLPVDAEAECPEVQADAQPPKFAGSAATTAPGAPNHSKAAVSRLVQQTGTGTLGQLGCGSQLLEQPLLKEQHGQQQAEGSLRTPLMHHAAIMHFATVKAAAATK